MQSSQLVWVAASVGGLLVLERVSPLRVRTRPSLPRLTVNAVVSACTLLTALVLVRPAAGLAMSWEWPRRFGILSLLDLTGWAEVAAAFVLMDLSFYYWHVANHRLPLLWRFHNAHHTDPDLDVTTGFRFHPGEVAISAGFRAVQAAVLGVTLPLYLAYETVFQVCTYFHHSNLRLPLVVERTLNLVLVTPRMHGIHHSDYRDETDSNYSVVFSLWDRLHGTLGLGIPQREITTGVPAYAGEADNRVGRVLALPFGRQRTYWTGTRGARLSRDDPRRLSRRLAE